MRFEFASSQVAMAIQCKLTEETILKSQQEFFSLFQSSPEALVHYQMDFSFGFSCYDPSNLQPMDELIRIADEKMHEEKKNNRKTLIHNPIGFV